MTNRTLTGLVLLGLTVGVAGCDAATAPGPTAPSPAPQQQTPSPVPDGPPGDSSGVVTADVTLSGVVFDVRADGRVPLEGVVIANGEGWIGRTDANGFFSFRSVWVCPCAAQPWVSAGTTFLWVGKEGYGDPPGQLPSVFKAGVSPIGRGLHFVGGERDVMMNGDTHVDILLMRR